MNGSDEFRHWPASDGAGLAASVSVFADRPALRDQMAEDLADAGFRLIKAGEVAALLDGELAALGDVVLLDCPAVDAGTMAALARLDMRVARSGAQLIVSTSLEALDDVFACFDQSRPQILVDPGRAERVVAVGRILGHLAGGRVRELSREDRAALLQLTQQVDAIARQLEGLRSRLGDDESDPKRLGDPRSAFRGFADSSRVEKLAKPGLPDARLVREIIRHRHARAKFFDAALFGDPAWDMLLDLTAAYAEKLRVSVTSLCIASGVPPTTALRWVRQMTEAGLFERVEDVADKRRAFISLSDTARDAMACYFAEIGEPALACAA
ncbi:MarR family winged helix-turn-helix transcriptional regulator [Altererythrobacter litoralis]|uniref:MarR family winged helix-turn-helix transcriptional regulator n=1 Tax=Altererythrobacter litoralis TaxID=3113904 RepID=A0ABU7GE98_9SPHN|nr:MarR family winged helix-turn-helix transcriptional regulator [Erythrobacteraceae bacterium 1XM1-14]